MSNDKPIVIKIGTSSIRGRNANTPEEDAFIDYEIVSKLVKAICHIEKGQVDDNKEYKGKKVLLVSSGAMGLGVAHLSLQKEHDIYKDVLAFKQAITAVGQIQLMNIYENVFNNYGFHVGQVLVTHFGMTDKQRSQTIKTTINKLFEINVIPIINENDTVCPEEIQFGDNDKLAAEIAVLSNAERLIILTDCDGLYDADPFNNPEAKLISQVNEITDDIQRLAGDSSSHVGLGGMKSKVSAAAICLKNGVTTNILNKDQIDKIPDLVLNGSGKSFPGTEFRS